MIEEHDHEYRSGIGTDIHEVVEDRKLMLGGVYVPNSDGLGGHSDGDVGLHAVIAALLGAAGMGDIGMLFPDTDPEYKDIRSTELLIETVCKLKERKIEIINIDSIIIAEEPKLASSIPQMKEILCPILRVEKDDLGIKAKTYEGLGAIGQGKAIAAWVHVLVKEKK